MGRNRRQHGRGENGTNNDDIEIRAVKMTLFQALKPKFRKAFMQLMHKWCLAATAISFLASLLLLFKANKAVDDDDENFFNGNGTRIIQNCFLEVLNRFTLPPEFRRMIENNMPNFVWPIRDGMNNAFNSLYEQYETNVKNNVKMHYVSRMKAFLKMKCFELNHGSQRFRTLDHFDSTDIKNTLKYLINQRIWTADPVRIRKLKFLLNEVLLVGGPRDFALKKFVNVNWFASLRMWIKIQRQISKFHMQNSYLYGLWHKYKEDPENNKKPIVEKPPKIRNFIAIPIHDFDLKHIKIDCTLFFEIACKLGALKRAKGLRGQPVNISREEYYQNPAQWWKYVFDMKKINKIGKRNKTFDCTIVTDSVSVSLMYIKCDRPLTEIDVQKIKDMYDNERFVYELGIDPGVRTWNATVRRHIATDTEVRNLVK